MKKKKIQINSGYKLWLKAKEVIPGGNSILSKRPERYAGKIWPIYFKKAKLINKEISGEFQIRKKSK